MNAAHDATVREYLSAGLFSRETAAQLEREVARQSEKGRALGFRPRWPRRVAFRPRSVLLMLAASALLGRALRHCWSPASAPKDCTRQRHPSSFLSLGARTPSVADGEGPTSLSPDGLEARAHEIMARINARRSTTEQQAEPRADGTAAAEIDEGATDAAGEADDVFHGGEQ